MVPQDILVKIVEAGIWAPSADNCQPWLFSWDGTTLQVIHDENRAKFLYNVNNIASYATLGGVIENIVIASEHFGYRPLIAYFPDATQEAVVANISFTPQQEKPKSELFSWIPKRMVNRKFYSKELIDNATKQRLLGIARDYPGTRFHWTDSKKQIRQLAALVAAGDRILFEHPDLHGGLFRWIRLTKEEDERARDGMGLNVLELNVFQEFIFPLLSSWKRMLILNKFGVSRLAATQSYRLLRTAPVACLIMTDDTAPVSYVIGGRLMQRVWLTASSLGVALQPLTGITFLISIMDLAGGKGLNPAHQAQVIDIQKKLPDIFPFERTNGLIMLFRMGRAPEPKAHSPRRPVEQQLTFK